jgi:hypothetical protein
MFVRNDPKTPECTLYSSGKNPDIPRCNAPDIAEVSTDFTLQCSNISLSGDLNFSFPVLSTKVHRLITV